MTPIPPNPWLTEQTAAPRRKFEPDLRQLWNDMLMMSNWLARQIIVEEELRSLRRLAA